MTVGLELSVVDGDSECVSEPRDTVIARASVGVRVTVSVPRVERDCVLVIVDLLWVVEAS